jgi:exopolyphosphatase/guanosine-5'-triphosphate,3'-diphosphate pyrophosphatase
VVTYNDHHHHSQMLIVSNGLPGFTPREIGLIALLARYHRKGTPGTDPFDRILDDSDGQLILQMAAILRVGEYLERGRNAAVDDVIVTWTDTVLRVTLVADIYPAVELWQAERYATALLGEAFDRRVVLDSTAAPAAGQLKIED